MKKYKVRACALLGLALLTSSCDTNKEQVLQAKDWQLMWSDDFEGTKGSLPDAQKWAFDIGTGAGGWGNQELEYYTARPENVSLDGDGNLVITAKSEFYGGASFTSGRIKTKGLFEQTYGRIEARIKNPYGPGIWPAFWMLGSNIDQVSWPQCGEIDIMEMRGQEPTIVNGTLHGPGYSGGAAITKRYALQNGRFDTDFHIYAVEWSKDYIDFFVDGYLYQRVTPANVTGEWAFDHPFFIILNLAVGGTFVGFPTQNTVYPQKMTVDYVRAYQKK